MVLLRLTLCLSVELGSVVKRCARWLRVTRRVADETVGERMVGSSESLRGSGEDMLPASRASRLAMLRLRLLKDSGAVPDFRDLDIVAERRRRHGMRFGVDLAPAAVIGNFRRRAI